MKIIGIPDQERRSNNNKLLYFSKVILISFTLLIINGYALCNKRDQYPKEMQSMPKYHQPGDSIYTVVQEPPKYKAGEFEFYVDLLERVEYIGWPMDEWQSQVVIEFVVDINGIVKDAKIKGKNKNEYTNMEKAFVKAIEGMKGWKVGFIEGVKVPTCIVRCIRVGRPTN